MMAPIVKKETEDTIVLVDSTVDRVFVGLFEIAVGSFSALMISSLTFAELNGGLLPLIVMVVSGLFGAYLLLWGLRITLVEETVIIDKRLRNVDIMEESFIKYLKSIKKIPFLDIKNIEVVYDTECEKCDYDSPSTSSWISNSWGVSLITSDEDSVHIYQSRYKSKAETMAEKICKITDVKVTHRTHYTPPDPCP
ncbi:MAG: hypothetical protein J7J06_06420 [Methanosarcinales archaeon]|nr:hypothetical protein [Methanosarcinales archaeon]